METLGRIAVEYEQVSFKFEAAGKTFTQSINALYTDQMRILDIIDFSGGLDKFNTNFDAFVNNFFTTQEKYDMALKGLEVSFDSLSIAMPKTEEEFKNLVMGFEVVDEATAQTYANLLSLSDGYAQYIDLQEELNDTLMTSLDSVLDMYLADYSYLTEAQKASLTLARYNSDMSTENAEAMLQANMQYTKSYEDSVLLFERTIAQQAQQAEEEATLADVVDELRAAREELESIKQDNLTIARAS